jgi:hypothetical protein
MRQKFPFGSDFGISDELYRMIILLANLRANLDNHDLL